MGRRLALNGDEYLEDGRVDMGCLCGGRCGRLGWDAGEKVVAEGEAIFQGDIDQHQCV